MRTSNEKMRFPGSVRTRMALAFGVAVLLIHTGGALCADLSGVVTSRRGLPLEHAKVVIKDGSGKVVKTVYTDKNGCYKVSGLDPGTYKYSVDGGPLGF